MNQLSKEDNRRKIMDSLIGYFGNVVLNSKLQEVADDILKSIEPKEDKELEEAAKERYPTESARKNMFHDNAGQYSRQEAFIEGAKYQIGHFIRLVNSYWRFDNNQYPLSSWHDKQDLLKLLPKGMSQQKEGIGKAIDITDEELNSMADDYSEGWGQCNDAIAFKNGFRTAIDKIKNNH